MEDSSAKSPILISEIHLQNLLSFGPDAKPIPLGPLNVLIGANGSGKSNLIEAIGLIKAMAVDLSGFVSEHGGIEEWIWKLQPLKTETEKPTFNAPQGLGKLRVVLDSGLGGSYYGTMELRANGTGFEISGEHFGDGRNHLYERNAAGENLITTPVIRLNNELRVVTAIHQDQSILVQAKDPQAFPELAEIGQCYSAIKAYGKFQFGRDSKIRQVSEKHRKGFTMDEDFSNLNAFLLRLFEDATVKAKYLEVLGDLFDGIEDIEIRMVGDFFQLRIKEGANWFPASRLSDGTMRYLCLIAILLDPTPPPLICIEEPELGMHPDLIVKIADLLMDASTRTQLVVTTHSDIIIDVLTDHPEYVFVCEKENGSTTIERLDPEKLKPWLEDYRLGALWTRGFLGGNRW